MLYKWCTAAILNTYYPKVIHLENDFDFGGGLTITKKPQWITDLENDEKISPTMQEVIKDSKYVIAKEYEAENYGSPDPEWDDKDIIKSMQDTAREEILLTNLALWMAKPLCLQYQVLHHAMYIERDRLWIPRGGGWFDPIVYNKLDEQAELNTSDWTTAKNLFTQLLRLRKTQEGNIWSAVNDLLWGLVVKKREIRFTMLWIALESLYGPQDVPQEIIHRIAQRAAFFLSGTAEERKSLYVSIKKSYSMRSKIIHGRAMFEMGKPENDEITKRAEEFVRQSLVKIIINDLLSTFDGDKRDGYLDGLIFGTVTK